MLPVSLSMCRRWKTSRTRPLFLRMWMRSSAVTMPAASWPRCCSTVRASYRAWLTAPAPTIPTIPHIFASLRHLVAEPIEPGVHVLSQRAGQLRGPRHDHRILPPRLAVHLEQLEDDDKRADDQHPASRRRRSRPARGPCPSVPDCATSITSSLPSSAPTTSAPTKTMIRAKPQLQRGRADARERGSSKPEKRHASQSANAQFKSDSASRMKPRK
jgi:hypothetical protein